MARAKKTPVVGASVPIAGKRDVCDTLKRMKTLPRELQVKIIQGLRDSPRHIKLMSSTDAVDKKVVAISLRCEVLPRYMPVEQHFNIDARKLLYNGLLYNGSHYNSWWK